MARRDVGVEADSCQRGHAAPADRSPLSGDGSTVRCRTSGEVGAAVDWISVALLIVALAWMVLVVFALRQIFTSPGIPDTNRLLWALIVLVAPVVGTLIWFFVGRPQVQVRGRR